MRVGAGYQSPSFWTSFRSSIALRLGRLSYLLSVYLLNNPRLLIALMAILRRVRPIAKVGRLMVVARHRDIINVLGRDNDMLTGEPMHQRLVCGDFLLGMDWRTQHDAERAELTRAVNISQDVGWIRTMVADEADTLIRHAGVSSSGKMVTLDVAQDFSEEIALRVLKRYLGVDLPPDGKTLLRCLSAMILVEPPKGSSDRKRVDDAAVLLSSHLYDQVAANRGAVGECANVPLVDRLVARTKAPNSPAWMTSEWIARFALGLLIFGVATVARATTHALDQLLRRDKAFAEAKLAAKNLTGAHGADYQASWEELATFFDEALRFRPNFPFLIRFSPRSTTIGEAADERRRVRSGCSVLAPPIAAMHDPEVFDSPRRFRTNRDRANYLHFGVGHHDCFGRFVAENEIIEMLRILLCLPGLGRAGPLKHDGPAVRSMPVTFSRP